MSPRVGPLEIGDDGRKHPGRERSDNPVAESLETKGQAAQVAEFRTGKHYVSLPALVVTAFITGFFGALIAWINKPTAAAVALTPEQSAALTACSKLADDVQEIKAWTRWAEPQIGILLVRTDQRAYSPPPRAP